MKNVEKLIEESKLELEEMGIHPEEKIIWKINRRAKSRWGLCKKYPNGKCEIQLAQILFTDDRISEKACKETIIHELLHTCQGCFGHKGKWEELAKEVNDRYRYNIKRVTSGAEKGIEDYDNEKKEYKYIFVCSGCGQIVRREKACKFTKYYRNYGCGICGKKRAFVKVESKNQK